MVLKVENRNIGLEAPTLKLQGLVSQTRGQSEAPEIRAASGLGAKKKNQKEEEEEEEEGIGSFVGSTLEFW